MKLITRLKQNKPCFLKYFFLGIISLTLFYLYLPILSHEFVNWDLHQYLLSNPYIQKLSISNIKKIFSILIYWMPVTWLSYSIEYHFAQFNPIIYHLTNIILHIINAILVFILSSTLLKKVIPIQQNKKTLIMLSLFISFIWACHPMRVEAVAWVINRKALLTSVFFLLSIIVYLKDAKKNKIQYFLALNLCGLLSMASHPSSVVLPVILCSIHRFLLIPPSGQHIKHCKVTMCIKCEVLKWIDPIKKLSFLFLFALLISIATYKAQYQLKAIAQISTSAKLSMMIQQIIFYIKQSFLPLQISPIYPPLSPTWNNKYTFQFLLIVIIAIIMIVSAKKHKNHIICTFKCFIICLIPTLGIVQAGWITHADRWSYLASIPIIITSVVIIYITSKKVIKQDKFIFLFFLIPIIILTILSKKQISVWKNDQTFFKHLYTTFPNCLTFKMFEADELIKKHQWISAKKILNNSLNTPHFIFKEFSYFGLGIIEKNQHNPIKALSYFKQSLAMMPQNYYVYIPIIAIHIDNNDIKSAKKNIKHLKQSLSKNQISMHPFEYIHLFEGIIELKQKQYLKALKHFTNYSSYQSKQNARINFWLGITELHLHNFTQAEKHLNSFINDLKNQDTVTINIYRKIRFINEIISNTNNIKLISLLKNFKKELFKLKEKKQKGYCY